MKWGIDISEHNRPLNWPLLKKQGLSFVILRLGWGAGHLDSRFYEYANGVLAAGLDLGVYYYSYALTEDAARAEARFTAAVLKDCGLYSSYSWLTDIIRLPSLPEGTPLWCAQWGSTCSQENARLWQFTSSLPLDGQLVDGNILR
ncbi:GH25 family lysozyme [uncultured Dialister sp.]|uniref:GH25 family lysozyme n=1 Tax=uncultured Dialister sp. TaxID=278064 RepID=UPI0027DC1436|nr:GH25 family lysozyme [uncultured Dialister sp.]